MINLIRQYYYLFVLAILLIYVLKNRFFKNEKNISFSMKLRLSILSLVICAVSIWEVALINIDNQISAQKMFTTLFVFVFFLIWLVVDLLPLPIKHNVK